MYTIEYEFNPGESVYVLIDSSTIKQGNVVQVSAKLYESVYQEQEVISLDVIYLVLLKDDETTVRVEVDKIFSTLDEVLNRIRELHGPQETT